MYSWRYWCYHHYYILIIREVVIYEIYFLLRPIPAHIGSIEWRLICGCSKESNQIPVILHMCEHLELIVTMKL
jgi:hypothetical protein